MATPVGPPSVRTLTEPCWTLPRTSLHSYRRSHLGTWRTPSRSLLVSTCSLINSTTSAIWIHDLLRGKFHSSYVLCFIGPHYLPSWLPFGFMSLQGPYPLLRFLPFRIMSRPSGFSLARLVLLSLPQSPRFWFSPLRRRHHSSSLLQLTWVIPPPALLRFLNTPPPQIPRLQSRVFLQPSL